MTDELEELASNYAKLTKQVKLNKAEAFKAGWRYRDPDFAELKADIASIAQQWEISCEMYGKAMEKLASQAAKAEKIINEFNEERNQLMVLRDELTQHGKGQLAVWNKVVDILVKAWRSE